MSLPDHLEVLETKAQKFDHGSASENKSRGFQHRYDLE